MNQGKLEVVKQEMGRVNIDILGISELKWTGMGSSFPKVLGQLAIKKLEKEMATHSSTLAWTIPWTEEPGEL